MTMHFIEFRHHVNQLLEEGVLSSHNDVLRYSIKHNQRREVSMRMSLESGNEASLAALFPCYSDDIALDMHERQYLLDHMAHDSFSSILRQMINNPEPYLSHASESESKMFIDMINKLLDDPSIFRYPTDGANITTLSDLILASSTNHAQASDLIAKAVGTLFVISSPESVNRYFSGILADNQAMLCAPVRERALILEEVMLKLFSQRIDAMTRLDQYDTILMVGQEPRKLPDEVTSRIEGRLHSLIDKLHTAFKKGPDSALRTIKGKQHTIPYREGYEKSMIRLAEQLQRLPIAPETAFDMTECMLHALFHNEQFLPSAEAVKRIIDPIKDSMDWPSFLQGLDDDLTHILIESFPERRYYVKHLNPKHLHLALESSFGL